MRITKLLSAAFLVAVVAAVSQSCQPKVQGPFSLAISVPRNEARVGSELKIKVVLTNTSDHVITVWRDPKASDQAELFHKVLVHDQAGKIATETRHGRRMRTGEDPPGELTVRVDSAAPYSLRPGEVIREEATIGKLYDLRQPGKYTIQVERIDDESKTVVRSNILTVTLTEGGK